MEKAKNNKSLLIALFALAVMLASVVVLKQRFSDWDEGFVQYEKYEAAPNFSLSLKKLVHPAALANKPELSLADLHGQPALIHFWATWCAPCREERPMLQALATRHSDGSLAIIGIASYEADASLQNSGLLADSPFTVLLDEQGDAAVAYKVRAIPQSVLVDGVGKIRYRVKGLLDAREIEQIESILLTIRKEEKLRGQQSAAVNP